ncbi:hypothetical protein [Polyangium sp. 6x1]|uniref:hypothetical protein n=1 Tax=Polyangium sp. 6x1 TaxID=3042689 RepID=UPI0024824F61|nr:hypothetical protein [Polyangium sp. 6x1]MDI1448662.1 hypothetical protein [Polyangium sp. 6x1]
MHKKFCVAVSMFVLAGLSVVLLGGTSTAIAQGGPPASCQRFPPLTGCVEAALDKQTTDCLTAVLHDPACGTVDSCLTTFRANLALCAER